MYNTVHHIIFNSNNTNFNSFEHKFESFRTLTISDYRKHNLPNLKKNHGKMRAKSEDIQCTCIYNITTL